MVSRGGRVRTHRLRGQGLIDGRGVKGRKDSGICNAGISNDGVSLLAIFRESLLPGNT